MYLYRNDRPHLKIIRLHFRLSDPSCSWPWPSSHRLITSVLNWPCLTFIWPSPWTARFMVTTTWSLFWNLCFNFFISFWPSFSYRRRWSPIISTSLPYWWNSWGYTRWPLTLTFCRSLFSSWPHSGINFIKFIHIITIIIITICSKIWYSRIFLFFNCPSFWPWCFWFDLDPFVTTVTMWHWEFFITAVFFYHWSVSAWNWDPFVNINSCIME